MRCHKHDADAIGICKHCQKGICEFCATDLGHGLACRGLHEGEVEALNSLIEKNKRAYESAPRANLFSPALFIIMGFLFVYTGYSKGFDSIPFICGVAFIIYGVSVIVYNSAYFRRLKTDYER